MTYIYLPTPTLEANKFLKQEYYNSWFYIRLGAIYLWKSGAEGGFQR